MKLLGIQTTNNFIYLENIYPNPFFLVNCNEYYDLGVIIIDNFMYNNYESYTNGETYLQSFGISIQSENQTTDDHILNLIIDFLTSISPNTQFSKLITEI